MDNNVSLNAFSESIQPFPFPSPASSSTGPELAGIKRFHIADDGYVTLHRHVDGKLKHLGGFTPSELDGMFPTMRAELAKDSYFSINAMWRSMPRGSASDNRYLNANYTDLDCYNVGLSVEVIAGKVIAAIAEGIIPSPSVIAFSGRGLWCYWLLRAGSDSNRRPRAYPPEEYLYKRVNIALGKRLRGLGADRNAVDSARITRVPGSLNTKADGDGRVHHYVNLQPDGRQREYLLSELAAFVGVEERPRPKFVRRGARRVPNRLNGWRARWAKAYGLLQALRHMRGGFRVGCRHNALFCLAVVGRRHGLTESALYAALLEVGQECKPSLPDDDAVAAFRSAMSMKGTVHLKMARMLEMLGVTEQELDNGLKQFLPKPKGRRRPSPRALRTEERRARVQDAWRLWDGVPTCAAVAEAVREPQPTVFRDMVALGLITPKRYSKQHLAPLLPFIHT